MKYLDGRAVIIGDEVALGGGHTGTVVCSIDDKRGTSGFPIDDWAYLGRGILIHSPQLGTLHFPEADADLVLLKRKGA